jgi:hypothetical protein
MRKKEAVRLAPQPTTIKKNDARCERMSINSSSKKHPLQYRSYLKRRHCCCMNFESFTLSRICFWSRICSHKDKELLAEIVYSSLCGGGV